MMHVKAEHFIIKANASRRCIFAQLLLTQSKKHFWLTCLETTSIRVWALMKFSGSSVYILSPHVTVAKLLSVSSWLAGRLQTDIWEMHCLVHLTQSRKYCSSVAEQETGSSEHPSAGGSQRLLYISGWGGSCYETVTKLSETLELSGFGKQN